MAFDHEAFRDAVLQALSDQAEALWDARLSLLEQESAEGWACFHAQPLWIRANVPPPLVDDVGRRYAVERLRSTLWFDAVGPGRFRSEFLEDFLERSALRAQCRNFVDADTIAAAGDADTFVDPVVAATARALRLQGREPAHEIAHDREAGWQAALQRGVHTPAQPMIERLAEDPLARYGLPKRVAEFSALRSPDWTLALMRALAPDFPHAAAPSQKKGLLFLKPVGERLAWAVSVDRESRGNLLRFPPILSLVWRRDPTGRRPPVTIVRDVLAEHPMIVVSWPREIEMLLTYHLQRARRLVALYERLLGDLLAA